MSKYLYGANGSKYKQVNYIPNESDHRGIVYFSQGGEFYRNSGGITHRMIERGQDTWASSMNFKNRPPVTKRVVK